MASAPGRPRSNRVGGSTGANHAFHPYGLGTSPRSDNPGTKAIRQGAGWLCNTRATQGPASRRIHAHEHRHRAAAKPGHDPRREPAGRIGPRTRERAGQYRPAAHSPDDPPGPAGLLGAAMRLPERLHAHERMHGRCQQHDRQQILTQDGSLGGRPPALWPLRNLRADRARGRAAGHGFRPQPDATARL